MNYQEITLNIDRLCSSHVYLNSSQ